MSDSPAEYRRKTEAMFAQTKGQVSAIAREFTLHLTAEIIERTPGFGNQYPEDTRYIPTGQLRGGWSIALEPLTVATVWEGGRRSDYGAEPYSEIETKVREAPIPAEYFLRNDVAYGHIVRWGMGRHTIIRDWPGDTAEMAGELAIRSREEVMGGAR